MNNAVTAAAAGAYVLDGKPIDAKTLAAQGISAAQLDNAYKGTMAYAVLSAHNTLPVTEKAQGGGPTTAFFMRYYYLYKVSGGKLK